MAAVNSRFFYTFAHRKRINQAKRTVWVAFSAQFPNRTA